MYCVRDLFHQTKYYQDVLFIVTLSLPKVAKFNVRSTDHFHSKVRSVAATENGV